jgi:hypothetical protein
MPKIFLILFLLISFLCFRASAGALIKQPIKSSHAILRTDNLAVNIRPFNNAAVNKYKQMPEFKYDSITPDSLWTRFWRWFWQWIENLFSNKKSGHAQAAPFVKYLVLGLAVCFLVHLVTKATGVINIFSKPPMQINVPYTALLENIDTIKFDEEIEKVVALGNYRLAVRLLYLSCLKQMNDKQLIKWQPEKTNLAYINELNDGRRKQSFGTLTRQFEYVWYGNFPLDRQSYQNVNLLFVDFKKTLS